MSRPGNPLGAPLKPAVSSPLPPLGPGDNAYITGYGTSAQAILTPAQAGTYPPVEQMLMMPTHVDQASFTGIPSPVTRPPPSSPTLPPLGPGDDAYVTGFGTAEQAIISPEDAASYPPAEQQLMMPTRVGGIEPPPDATPPSFDLSKSDPAGWAAYQQDVKSDDAKVHKAMRAETAKVLPPLGSGQNAYVLYKPDGSVDKLYSPGHARNLPPDQAALLVAVTVRPSLWNRIKRSANKFENVSEVTLFGGTYDKGTEDIFDETDEAIEDVEDVTKEAVADAETVGDKLADAGAALLDDLEGMAKDAPYLLIALAVGAAFFVVRPMLTGPTRSE